MDSIEWIIINKSLDGSLNDQESEILSEWLAESAEHRALYQKIKAYDSYSLSDEKFEQWRSEYTDVLSRLKQHRNRRFIRRKILVDRNKPFIVKTNDMNILVRGTSFNINAYPDYKIVRTTLVNGKIDVECSGNTHTILPGQQIVFEKETRSVKIQEVDTELYLSLIHI